MEKGVAESPKPLGGGVDGCTCWARGFHLGTSSICYKV